jgi:hypothetical protein
MANRIPALKTPVGAGKTLVESQPTCTRNCQMTISPIGTNQGMKLLNALIFEPFLVHDFNLLDVSLGQSPKSKEVSFNF